MNLTWLVKVQPTPEQAGALRATMERFNAACNAIAAMAFRERTANTFRLQKLGYPAIRREFGLSAQLTGRALSKVAEADQGDTGIQPHVRPHGAIVYDPRVLSWQGPDRVSILTLAGRQIIPVVLDGYHEGRWDRIRGQAELIYRDGQFSWAVVVDVPELPPLQPDAWLGVDLGIVNLAADLDGEAYSGGQVNGLRKRHAKLRQRLQKKGTQSAKRLLKKRRRKEHRFAANVNPGISKRLVATAQGTGRGIAVEDLQGIRDRATVRKAQRRSQPSGAFHQLRACIVYKARLPGVPVVFVDPRNTSRTCPACEWIEPRNRPDQAHFRWARRPHAARNIASRAAVNQPNAAVDNG